MPPDDDGWDMTAAGEAILNARPFEPDDAAGIETLAAVTDDALALAFSAAHADALRYVAGWGRWLQWTGSVWRHDDTLFVFHRVRRLCRAAAGPNRTPAEKRALADAQTVAAVERLARCDRRHAATVDQWDADPWLLGTPGGTVDLRTGRLRPADRADHLTKLTAVAPDFEADCPLWLAFLERVTAGDTALQKYLQRLAGYCLTGSTREQIFAFLYGTGANGKGVFLNTLTAVFCDYGHVAPASMFEVTTGDRHPTELAALRGARLVTAQETEAGRRWAENRIKALTGDDPITARYMRQDFFTFRPSFKILIAGNHKPGLRNVDEAMRRRLHMVPFEVQIPKAERDLHLAEKLRAEHPAILAWAIRGCLDWQADGLQPPARVLAATAEYLAAQDSFALWLDESTERGGPYDWESAADLTAGWKRWAEAAGEAVGTRNSFADRMRAAGFEPARKADASRARGYAGIRLIRANYTDDARYGG